MPDPVPGAQPAATPTTTAPAEVAPAPMAHEVPPPSQEAAESPDEFAWLDRVDSAIAAMQSQQAQPQPNPQQQYRPQPPMPPMNQQLSPEQQRAAMIDAFVRDPESFIGAAARNQVMPLVQALGTFAEQLHRERFNQAKESSMSKLRDMSRSDPALRNDAVRRHVAESYMTLYQQAAAGDGSAVEALRDPRLPWMAVDLAKRMVGYNSTATPNPVRYSGGNLESGYGTMGARPQQYNDAAAEMFRRWGLEIPADQWAKNEVDAERFGGGR